MVLALFPISTSVATHSMAPNARIGGFEGAWVEHKTTQLYSSAYRIRLPEYIDYCIRSLVLTLVVNSLKCLFIIFGVIVLRKQSVVLVYIVFALLFSRCFWRPLTIP